jgi:hypothetical protein
MSAVPPNGVEPAAPLRKFTACDVVWRCIVGRDGGKLYSPTGRLLIEKVNGAVVDTEKG